MKQNEYIDKKKIPINCLKKKGLGDLFEEIYNEFKNKIIIIILIFLLKMKKILMIMV